MAENTKRLTVELPVMMHRHVKAVAAERGQSMGAVVTGALSRETQEAPTQRRSGKP